MLINKKAEAYTPTLIAVIAIVVVVGLVILLRSGVTGAAVSGQACDKLSEAATNLNAKAAELDAAGNCNGCTAIAGSSQRVQDTMRILSCETGGSRVVCSSCYEPPPVCELQPVETLCEDGCDNDVDGLIDAKDPDCPVIGIPV